MLFVSITISFRSLQQLALRWQQLCAEVNPFSAPNHMMCPATFTIFFTRERLNVTYHQSQDLFVRLKFFYCTPEPQLIIPENLTMSHGLEKMETQAEHTKNTQNRNRRRNEDEFQKRPLKNIQNTDNWVKFKAGHGSHILSNCSLKLKHSQLWLILAQWLFMEVLARYCY